MLLGHGWAYVTNSNFNKLGGLYVGYNFVLDFLYISALFGVPMIPILTVKAVLLKNGLIFKCITKGELSIFVDDETIWFEDTIGSTKTIRRSTFNENNLLKKVRIK